MAFSLIDHRRVVPNATMAVLRELAGDGAARQALWVRGYVSTSGRIKPEIADMTVNTDARYERLVADSLAILGQLKAEDVVRDIVVDACRNPRSMSGLLTEIGRKRHLDLRKKRDSGGFTLIVKSLSRIEQPNVEVEMASTKEERRTREAVRIYLVEQAQLAYDELRTSLRVTLIKRAGHNPGYTHGAERRGGGRSTYEFFGQGIKIHLKTGDLHVQGLEVNRVVVEPGTYRAVRSRAKTLAKDALRRRLPLHRWCQLVLRRGKFKAVLIRNRRFGPEDFAPPKE